MSYVGEFHEVEKDGKVFELVYHHPMYHPVPETQSSSSSAEAINDDTGYYDRFLCPTARLMKDMPGFPGVPLNSPPGYVLSSTKTNQDHPVLPLYWCNNKEFEVHGGCSICEGLNFGTNYYYCIYCNKRYHKECVQSPLKIKHPFHPEHPLQLYYNFVYYGDDCLCCGRMATCLVYHCSICKSFAMHPICAMNRIPFVIDPPKTHHHPLTLFPRQSSLTCNVCGLLRKNRATYICARCNFVAHKDCMYTPRIIKISRHLHRISHISSLGSGEWSCGVCRENILSDYGAYICDKCSGYAVHSRCAIRQDVWDGEDLEGVPEDDDITQDDGPFVKISQEVILYFLHDDHHLKLEVDISYDEKNICQACILPIYEGNLYSCMKCDFILHETCSNAPRRIQHVLHPHPLTLKTSSSVFSCSICYRRCGGFVYECRMRECDFNIDIRCALVSEPFDYKGHEHPLFLALDTQVYHTCHVCKSRLQKQLNCIKCNFLVCMRCITLPYKTRYKHDPHFLTMLFGKDIPQKNWCEVCERDLEDQGDWSKRRYFHFRNVFYSCEECCTTFHFECLIGEDPYLKPGQDIKVHGQVVQIHPINNPSRPLCGYCKNPCQGKLFKTDSKTACSEYCIDCMFQLLY